MYILHVHTLPIISGSGINTLLTMKGSYDRGHRVALACEGRGRLTEEVESLGMEVHLVPSMRREVHPARDLAAILALSSLMRRREFALVHTHNSKAGFLGRKAARLAKVPEVIHTVHGFAFHDQEPALRRVLYRTLERRAAHWCDGIIFISGPLMDWARREGIGTRVTQTLIHSGIDADAFHNADGGMFRKKWAIDPDRLVVGIISKLWEGKGHDLLLQAWKMALKGDRLPGRPLLLIVGEGHLEQSLRARVEELGLEGSVLFTGFQSDVPAATAALDISVLPSFFEGMGRVVLEAKAAGKPVIASRVGGIPELVQDGESGFLIPVGDCEHLAGALLRMMSDPELRERMGKAARASLRPEHTAAHMVDEIHRFYARCEKPRH